MNKNIKKNQLRDRRRGRIRAKISGTAKKPRLSVYRSLSGMYAQLIDDENGKTLASADIREIKGKGSKTEKATKLGSLLAEKAKKAKIEEAVFDRGGFKYHGRVKAIAEAAREAGLNF